MRPYETMYILRPDLGDGEVEGAVTKYQTFLQDQGAESLKVQHRGKRRLAYEIGKYREGVYIQMNYQAKPGTIELLERSMRLSDDVIRYMTLTRASEDLVADTTEVSEPETAAS